MPVRTLSGVREAVALVLAPRPEVLAGYIFGSVASGRARPDSDVDVAVLVKPAVMKRDPSTYRLHLMADLRTALQRSDVDTLKRAPVVDKNVVLSRVSKGESVGRLVALATLGEKAFTSDADACAIAERHLQIAIQAVTDMGNHVVADLDLGTPSDYKDIFALLSKHRVVSTPLAKKLAAMAGMRNVLVHDYMKVDLGLLYRTPRRDLGDFGRFVGAILKPI